MRTEGWRRFVLFFFCLRVPEQENGVYFWVAWEKGSHLVTVGEQPLSDHTENSDEGGNTCILALEKKRRTVSIVVYTVSSI